ncbi:MAG: replication-associated recombination protein A, partial [Duncaniella sp.]|nr:replication-associated recombination protein A [Duncaniella sp.]
KIGWPEGRIPLAECAVYLALSPKSNSAYKAIDAALAEVRESGDLPVPLHLRNAPTKLMKEMGYGRDYKYAHDYPGNFVVQQYMPDSLGHRAFWTPCDNPAEVRSAQLQNQRWRQEEK